MKVFTGHALMVPKEWKDVINTETHHAQADVIIVAASKKAAVEMLVAAGNSQRTSEVLLSECRMRPAGRYDNATRDLLAAGVLDLDTPAAVVYRRSSMGQPIVRVDTDTLPVVARFAYRSGLDADRTGLPYGLYVEAVQS
jgi:hypothetical protein